MGDDLQLKRSFEAIVIEHMALFPESEVEDLYKLVFQAAMGSEHAVTSVQSVHGYLQAEADGLALSMDLPLMIPLSPDQRLVRIHVHPFLAVGGDLEALALAFMKTSQVFAPSVAHLMRYWAWTEAMAGRGDLPCSHGQLHRHGARRRTQGYPAVHHSPRFRRLYRPAYRVVLKELIEGSLG